MKGEPHLNGTPLRPWTRAQQAGAERAKSRTPDVDWFSPGSPFVPLVSTGVRGVYPRLTGFYQVIFLVVPTGLRLVSQMLCRWRLLSSNVGLLSELSVYVSTCYHVI